MLGVSWFASQGFFTIYSKHNKDLISLKWSNLISKKKIKKLVYLNGTGTCLNRIKNISTTAHTQIQILIWLDMRLLLKWLHENISWTYNEEPIDRKN